MWPQKDEMIDVPKHKERGYNRALESYLIAIFRIAQWMEENGQSLQVYFTNQFSRLDKNGFARSIDKILRRLRAWAY